MTRKATIAHKIHAEIGANVDAYYATDDSRTFTTRNRNAWDRAALYGVADAVSALIRGDAADFDRLVA